MAGETNLCYSSLQACRLRATLLEADGTPDAGADAVVVTDALIDIGYKIVLKEGAKFDLENGCGVQCLTFQDRDKIQSVDLSMTLCKLDAALIHLLTGATLVIESNVIRGFAIPDTDAELDQEVSIEAWSKAWDGDQQASLGGNLLHDRFIFPRTTWTLGDGTLENNPFKVPLTGRGKGNSLWGDGPANDVPYNAYLSPMGVYFDDNALPDPVCGLQTLVAS